MKDYLNIGPTPTDEECLPAGSDPVAAREECRRFIDVIRRVHGNEPEGARLAVKSFPHDFGTYYEVVCHFDDAYEAAVDYAFKVEGDAPMRWTDGE